ncbi:head-tail connector protein [Mesorhizobium sp. BH1-1-5]|uniref:head-tail connector protein n=1 Tax=Mesorhizobium sp. BH1-1-5 TaxID=2876661 RepID=UPI001CCE3E6F|nr:head-tail connector protein [Mesorhizobium sp. BH1-1-5]MBZ9985674.1 head-tail connector protein [Mesorhizobium sp. BH1-1-5]
MLRPVRTTAPTAAVSLDEIKRHANAVDFTDDDELLGILVQTATDHLDGWTGVLGRCIVNQGWRQDFGCWPACRDLRLPFPDVANIVVKYSDTADAEQTVSNTLYETLSDARGAFIRLRDNFDAPALNDQRSDPVRIEFTAGFGAVDAVPSAIKVAIMMLAAHWYANREAVAIGDSAAPLPMAVDALIAPYRRVGV